jgi:hypothetical protein
MRNDSILTISIFQEAYPLDETKVSAEEYLDHFGFEIDRIGRVFKCLGLTQPATRSDDFAWNPAPMLMKYSGTGCASLRGKQTGLSH